LKKRELTLASTSRNRAKLTEAMLRGVEAGLLVADGGDWVLL
jgi:hypothetical protein